MSFLESKVAYFLRYQIELLTNKLTDNSSRNVDDLSEWLDIPKTILRLWLNGIPEGYDYTTFNIPKKSGRRYRHIDAPNPALKSLQRCIYHKLLKRLRPHQAATAYIKQKSICDNALPHVGQDVVINIDLKDFFHSIKSNKVYRYWRFLGWDVETSTILRNICCYNGSLPQGAPTSPSLSNLCNQLLDARLAAVAKKIKGKYTRYSDDITFSFSKTYAHQKGILRKINDILESEGYQIQKKKRIRIQRSHQRQITTGLIVNEKLNLPRETRKRIRAMRHHLFMGKLSEVEIRCLAGYENLLKQIDEVNKTNPKKKIELNKLLKISRGTDSQINTKRVLFLASSPINENRLNLDREAREIDATQRYWRTGS
jgi:RNA-directed DNA polymerase